MAAVATVAALGWYSYGVVATHGPGPSSWPAAVDSRHGVERIEHASLTALVSRVPLSEFDERPLQERLNDLEWLERAIRAHESVVEQALASGPVVPFRFCTIYRTEAELRKFLTEREQDLTELLRRLEGRFELGVKAYVDLETLTRALAEDNTAERNTEPVAAGRAYLLRRQRERAAEQERARFLAECASRSHERLLEGAEDGRANPPQARELSGRHEEMVLNGAYLVADEGRGLEAAVDALRAKYARYGISFEITGPWPAYNFAQLTEASES